MMMVYLFVDERVQCDLVVFGTPKDVFLFCFHDTHESNESRVTGIKLVLSQISTNLTHFFFMPHFFCYVYGSQCSHYLEYYWVKTHSKQQGV